MRHFVAAVLFIASPLLAAESRVERDIAYVEPKNERQTLDIYAPASGSDHPIVVWIHGGGSQPRRLLSGVAATPAMAIR